MKYALGYDSKHPAILFSVNADWLLEVLGSEAGRRIVGYYETADLSCPFELDSQTGLGFGGVMKPMAERNPLCPPNFTQYRLDLPVMFKEDDSEECLYCRDAETTTCKYCKGTGHFFRIDHVAGDDFGRTLSAVTSVIDQATRSNLCDYVTGGLAGVAPVSLQPLHLDFHYRIEGGEHSIRLWISPDAYTALYVASTISRNCRINSVEEATVSAHRHISDGSGSGLRPQSMMLQSETGWLLLGTEDEGGLVQTDRLRMSPYDDGPVEMFSHHLEGSYIAFSVLAGIAELYTVLFGASYQIHHLKAVTLRKYR